MSGHVEAAERASEEGRQAIDRLDVNRLMTVEEVAEYLRVPVNTLYQWRHKGRGPRAFRVGRFLRYDPAEIRGWLHEHAGMSHGLD